MSDAAAPLQELLVGQFRDLYIYSAETGRTLTAIAERVVNREAVPQ